MQDKLKEEKEKRRLKVWLERMERLYKELSLQMGVTGCHCGCSEEEEDQLNYICVENMLGSVDSDGECSDPLSMFGERGQVSDQGQGLHWKDRISHWGQREPYLAGTL